MKYACPLPFNHMAVRPDGKILPCCVFRWDDVPEDLNIVNWGEVPNFDMVINATSLGLKQDDRIEIDFSSTGKNKFFYDVIYNFKETHFLKLGREMGNKTENGEKMFIYQAHSAFNIWHGVQPNVNQEITELLKQ